MFLILYSTSSFSVADQAVLLFIPQTVLCRLKGLPEGEGLFLEAGIFATALLKIIVGYLGPEVMDVMIPDVAGELSSRGAVDSDNRFTNTLDCGKG